MAMPHDYHLHSNISTFSPISIPIRYDTQLTSKSKSLTTISWEYFNKDDVDFLLKGIFPPLAIPPPWYFVEENGSSVLFLLEQQQKSDYGNSNHRKSWKFHKLNKQAANIIYSLLFLEKLYVHLNLFIKNIPRWTLDNL